MTPQAPLTGRHIVLGLTGGIACYKAAMLCRLLRTQGATVQVVMTEAATQFITPVTMQALSSQPVFTSQWDSRPDGNMAHIDLSRYADLILICPCSADFMAKLANGLCDDLLSTLCVARPDHGAQAVSLAIVPAMNVEMWENRATRRNHQQLIEDGVHVLGPASGDQACGETGAGRMLEPAEIAEAVHAILSGNRLTSALLSTVPTSLSSAPPSGLPLIAAPLSDGLLAGRRVVITAGPTFEAIDPVRGITNRSSGKMGFALAQAAKEAGASVHLVSGPVTLATPAGVRRTDVVSAQNMYDAVLAAVSGSGLDNAAAGDFIPPDLFIAVAAVADWRVASPGEQKLKKQPQQHTLSLELVQNPDILATVAMRARDYGQRHQHAARPYCVGFAAETENLEQHAAEKRLRKGIPLIIGNLAQHTFGSNDNQLVLFDETGRQEWPTADKLTLARQLVADLAKRLVAQDAPTDLP